jgi:cyanophycinase-like exopeptidase
LELASRLTGEGRLALVGGGEFSFGETLEADRLWLEASPAGTVGFLPTASGSDDYGRHFGAYLAEAFGRDAVTVPVYRLRDARREKNADRIRECAAIYIGGGSAEQLVETIAETAALAALEDLVTRGGTVVAVAAAAQAAGMWLRSLGGGDARPAFGWLGGTVVEPNFLPTHDRRLRELMQQPGVERGIGLPAGSCLLLPAAGDVDLLGSAFALEEVDGDLKVLAIGTEAS